jgi:hypothetical protein
METPSEETHPESVEITYEDILDVQTDYYQTHNKNTFFKKQQKFECAEMVCNRIPLESLINQTCWIIPNMNQMVFDYRIFKMYANPANYMEIVENVLVFCNWCVKEYGTFEFNFNLESFTISAAERYKDTVVLFCDECFKRNTRFSESLIHMNIYNMPNVIDQISRMLLPLIPVETRPKIRLFSKTDSELTLIDLYAKSGKTYIHNKAT